MEESLSQGTFFENAKRQTRLGLLFVTELKLLWRNRVMATRNVRFWPNADILSCTAHVRFQE
jgi:hypothetical protein